MVGVVNLEWAGGGRENHKHVLQTKMVKRSMYFLRCQSPQSIIFIRSRLFVADSVMKLFQGFGEAFETGVTVVR